MALKMKVTQDNKEIITRLPSSRLSPSPINYLQKVRDDREKLGMMRYPEDLEELGAGGASWAAAQIRRRRRRPLC